MIRFVSKLAVLALALPILAFSAPAYAATGQIEGGDIYWSKNITKGSGFVDPTSADAGDTLLYRVRIHNPGEVCLTNVNLKAILPSGVNSTNTSTITIWADSATTNYISDTATINLSSGQSISYTPGTTQLLDQNGAVISTLPDTILSSGVNIGGVCVSVNNKRFVQFQAKVSVPSVATPVVTKAGATTTKALPNTGPGDVLGAFAGASAAGAGVHYAISSRRNRR